jgi:hypothetical protein
MNPIKEMRFLNLFPVEDGEIHSKGFLRFVRMPLAVIRTVGRRFA